MKQLFSQALKKLIEQSQLTNKNRTDIGQQIVNIYKHDIAFTKLCRLPNSEIKNMLQIPCPLVRQVKPERNHDQILVFKRLRHYYNVEEETVCFKCPKAKQCQFQNTKYRDVNIKMQIDNNAALHDLFYYFISLEKQNEQQVSILRWSAAYKVVTSLTVLLKDFKILSKQSLLFRELMKNKQYEQNKQQDNQQNVETVELQKMKNMLKQRKIHLQSRSSPQVNKTSIKINEKHHDIK